MRTGWWVCRFSAWHVRGHGGKHSLPPFGPSAHRSGALLPGVQGSSQAVRSLGVFVFHPETEATMAVRCCSCCTRHASWCEMEGDGQGRAGLTLCVDLGRAWAWPAQAPGRPPTCRPAWDSRKGSTCYLWEWDPGWAAWPAAARLEEWRVLLAKARTRLPMAATDLAKPQG